MGLFWSKIEQKRGKIKKNVEIYVNKSFHRAILIDRDLE